MPQNSWRTLAKNRMFEKHVLVSPTVDVIGFFFLGWTQPIQFLWNPNTMLFSEKEKN